MRTKFDIYVFIHVLWKDTINSDQWSAIPHISTKRTSTSLLKVLNTKKTTTYADGNTGHGFGQAHKCGWD